MFPTWDKTLPTVIACLDRAMRRFGGAPTYWLTDNEKTVTTGHVAGIAVRHPLIVEAGLHYGVTIATCVPADPESKGGSEATVRIAKADLVPTEVNLRDDYRSWAELTEACEAFMGKVNGREHRVTRRVPTEMLADETQRLHRIPDVGFTAAFGETRKLTWSSTISYGGVTYSVPHTLAVEEVWVRPRSLWVRCGGRFRRDERAGTSRPHHNGHLARTRLRQRHRLRGRTGRECCVRVSH